MSLPVGAPHVTELKLTKENEPLNKPYKNSWREDEKMLLLSKWEEFQGDWEKIHPFFPNRSLEAIKKRISLIRVEIYPNPKSHQRSRKKRRGHKCAKWKLEEEALLKQLVQKYITNPEKTKRPSWSCLEGRIPGKNARQCQYHFQTSIDPTVYRGDWTPEENALILRMKLENPKVTSNIIADTIQKELGYKRVSKLVYLHWLTLIGDENISRKHYNLEEESSSSEEEFETPPIKKAKIEKELSRSFSENENVSSPKIDLSTLTPHFPLPRLPTPTLEKDSHSEGVMLFDFDHLINDNEFDLPLGDSEVENIDEQQVTDTLGQVLDETILNGLNNFDALQSPLLPLEDQKLLDDNVSSVNLLSLDDPDLTIERNFFYFPEIFEYPRS